MFTFFLFFFFFIFIFFTVVHTSNEKIYFNRTFTIDLSRSIEDERGSREDRNFSPLYTVLDNIRYNEIDRMIITVLCIRKRLWLIEF